MTEPTASGDSSYARMHQEAGIGSRYDERIYASGGYDDFIWSLERPILQEIVRGARARLGSIRYLDFACGTGRVISSVEGLVDSSVGVDISPHMIEPARGKVSRSELMVADILADPDVAVGPYDLVTAFRFFLNTEPAIRTAVLAQLRRRLAAPDSLLVFNIHGNSRSSLGLTSVYRRLRGWGSAWLMSEADARRMVEAAGFEVESVRGFGLWPKRLYVSPVGGLVRAVDRAVSAIGILRPISHDLLFVCRRGGQPD